MEYDAIVIGAGVAGLSSSLKLSLQGKKVLLLEKQPLPGGFATTFKRNGFVFEAAIHCVSGLEPGSEIRNFLEESGVSKKVEFINLKDFARIIYPAHNLVIDFNCRHFIDFLKDNFPREKNSINRLFGGIERFYVQFDRFCDSRLPMWLNLFFSPLFYPALIRISSLNTEQFMQRYIKDEKLIAIITDIWKFLGLPPSKLSALYFLLTFRGYFYNPSAQVKGGFSRLIGAMVEKIKETGSEVRFNTKVVKIITQGGNTVKSVVTEKGEEFKTKAVISNANAIDTLTKMLDNDKLREEYRGKLSSLEKSLSAVQVYLGLKVPARRLGMTHSMFCINTTYNHQESFNYSLSGDYDKCALEMVDHAQVDPTLVPEGKGSLLIISLDSYSNWNELNDEEYKIKKEEAARKFIDRAQKYLPGLRQYIEVVEIATPRTMERFALSPEGAIYGFSQSVSQSGFNRLGQQTKINGLFLAGAWTRPGAGAQACFFSGLDAADLVLEFLKHRGI